MGIFSSFVFSLTSFSPTFKKLLTFHNLFLKFLFCFFFNSFFSVVPIQQFAYMPILRIQIAYMQIQSDIAV